MATPYLPPYLDLDRGFRTPATGQPGQTGWWRQVAANINVLNEPFASGSGVPSVSGHGTLELYESQWSNVTEDTSGLFFGDEHYAYYRQIGSVVDYWTAIGFDTGDLTGHVGVSLPVPHARRSFTQIIGNGDIDRSRRNPLAYNPFDLYVVCSPDLDPDTALLYHGNLTTNEVDNNWWTTDGEIRIYCRYFTESPADTGRLTNRDFVMV